MDKYTLEHEWEMLERRQQQIVERLATLDRFGEDVYEPGTVIVFKKQFDSSPRVYDYAAMKCDNGFWYTTGPAQGNTPRTWTQLIGWLTSGKNPTNEIWRVTEYEEIV